MDQERADYADPSPPSRLPPFWLVLTIIFALTVFLSLLICGGLLFLLARELGPK